MQKLFFPYRIGAVALAFLVLFSSVGVAVDKHFCKDQLREVSIFGKTQSCQPPAKTKACKQFENGSRPSVPRIVKRKCCTSETEIYQTDQLRKQLEAFYELPAIVKKLVIAYCFTQQRWPIPSKSFDAFVCYSPPECQKDIPSTYQIFLI